jgi:sugar phosphate isomerase/epimerase
MQIGVCTGLDGLNSGVDGLAYIEPTVDALLCPKEDDAAFEAVRAKAQALSVLPRAVNCFLPGDLKTTGPHVDPAAVDARVRTACARAAKVGVEIIVFGSGGSRRVPDGFDRGAAGEQLVGHLKRFGRIAAKHGVTIVLEPLSSSDCNIVTSVDEGAGLVRAADHPNIRLLIDTYHMARDDDPVDSIRRAEGLIAHVHCAEGDGRGPLGARGEDQRAYFRALKDIGYEGRISLECRWDDLEGQLPAGVAELRRQWDGA